MSITEYTRYRDYSDFQSASPDTDLNGADLDADFDAIKAALDSVTDAVEDVRRSDGALINDSVGPDQLTSAVVAMMGDWLPRGAWVTATAYAVKNIVLQTNVIYACVTAHTSGTFATDLAAGKWMQISPATSGANVANTPAGNIAATTVQAALNELDTEKQPLDAELTAIAGLVSAANKFPYFTGSGTAAAGDLTAAARALLDDANSAAMLVTLGALPLAGGTLTGNLTLSGDPSTALMSATKQYVDNILGSAIAPFTGGGRLSLTLGLSVTVADVTAATVAYYTPHSSNIVPIYTGAAWEGRVFTERVLNLDSNSGHTGYHQTAKNFDAFIFDDAGTLRLATGPSWTSDTARSAAIARKDGRWTNNASIVLRWGNGNTDTSTVAANLALYVGTFRTTADGQTEDSFAKRFVWNTYNRVMRGMRVFDVTDSWSYATGTFRQARATATNQLDFVRGLDEDAITAFVMARGANDTAGHCNFSAIGLDSTTVVATTCLMTGTTSAVNNAIQMSAANLTCLPGIGRHTLVWLEAGTGFGTQTNYGDAGSSAVQSGISGNMLA